MFRVRTLIRYQTRLVRSFQVVALVGSTLLALLLPAAPALGAPPLAPAAPTVGRPVGVGGALAVFWVAPGDNGLLIWDYDVRYGVSSGVGAWGDWGHTGTATSTTITGLTNGTEYVVQVRATNDQGTSAWSESGTNTPADKPLAPAAPTVAPTVGVGGVLGGAG